MADADRVSGRARKRGGGGDDDFRALREAIETEVPSFGQIAEMLELARRRDRLNFAERIVDRRLQEIGDDAIHWTVPDRLSGYRDLLVESKTLVRLKYGFEECPADIDILAVADRMAHRVVPDPVALDRLFAVSRSGVERDEWESQVRQAFVIDQIVNDRNEIGLPGAAVLAPIRPGAWDAIAREIRDADRIVCLVFHSGFLSITRFLYAQIPSSAAIRGRHTRRGGPSPNDKGRSALFAAFRDLQDGKPLLVAPDGPAGKLTEMLEVLGASRLIGEGAAFLAFEADARTVWLNVVREGTQLVPVLVEGPRRATGEKYPSFKARWAEFYGRQITEVLTGHPASLALRGRWSNLFSADEADEDGDLAD